MDAAPGRFAALKSPKVRGILSAAALLSLLGAGGYYLLVLKPRVEGVMLRAQTLKDVFALYDLQVAHRERHGRYAADLESLLKLAPGGGAALRERLRVHAHLDTLVVAGDEAKFRLEANVRDAARTLVQVKGPRTGDPLPPKP